VILPEGKGLRFSNKLDPRRLISGFRREVDEKGAVLGWWYFLIDVSRVTIFYRRFGSGNFLSTFWVTITCRRFGSGCLTDVSEVVVS